MYVNCKSYFSFRYGTFSTEELVKAGVEAGATALALTNINGTCDAWDFLQLCKEEGIQPILGAEIRNGNKPLYLLLAANNRGYAWINAFLSEHLLAKKEFPERTTDRPFFANPGDGFVIYPLKGKAPEELLSNEYIGVQPGEVNQLLRMPVKEFSSKWVIRQPVTFQNKTYYNLHRLLRAVDRNELLSRLDPEELAGEQEYFIPPADLLEAFRKYPGIVTNTLQLIEACHVTMDFGVDKNKKTFSATREDDRVLLKKLAGDGFLLRYGTKDKVARERMTRELGIIDQMGFTAYFLIAWDMIRYAQSRGFYHVGRGSGANSLVAYCLQITDVDPIALDLYFERFLNPSRTSPPDFDIDFSYRDRDEIIDYMFKRYGKRQVVLLGMYTTFQYNAIIRELGKVFGLPKAEIDQLAEKGYYYHGGNENFMKKTQEGKIQRIILQYGKLLQNFPSHLSIHPGGILISEEPLDNYCAVYMPPKGFPTAQLDMFVAENIGLFKLDVLSQRGLGHIKESLQLIKRNRQIDIDIHQVQQFMKDDKVREQIRTVNTIGCFYIESPAMRHLLKKLRCDDYLTLVAASSIIRPGVGKSGMMQQYIQRFHHPDKFEYLHPKLEELLKETYGVMVYQEDVLKVAHFWAGMDMADADLLRRATSSKYRGKKKLLELKDRFFANCNELGYPLSTTEEVWRQIESFADYSFCKAHSASYAVESYQSLFLKTHFPMEFAVAVINNFGGFYSRELYFYELMKTGARVHPPCVNNSEYYTNIKGKDVYTGFIHIRGFEQAQAETILSERRRGGPYLHLADFVERTAITPEQLELLLRIGALRFTGKNKKELLWEGDFLQKKNKSLAPAYQVLFKEPPLQFQLPELPVYPLDDLYDQIELLGFPLTNPFDLVDEDPAHYLPARELGDHVGKIVRVLGYHITHKPVRTVKGDTMSFGTFLDLNLDWIDTVHFPEIHALHPPQSGFYKIRGKVMEEFGVHSIEVTGIEKAGIRGRTT